MQKRAQAMAMAGQTNVTWHILAAAALALGVLGLLAGASLRHANGQAEQRIEITIKDFTFMTRQMPLQLATPTVITIRNEDAVRHDFGSVVFDGTPAQVESGGVISYGRGIGGVFLDPDRTAHIRFTIDRPGRYEFRCSIHPDMKGEILLMNVGAV
jgi:plastocyanin